MNEKRFTLDEEENGLCRCILVDGEYIPTCEICDLLNKQQTIINILLEELINAQNQGYVVGFLHKNGRCNLTPKELEDE